MINIFIIDFIFLIEIKYFFCTIVLPIYSLPKENYKFLYDTNSPKDNIYNEYKKIFYTFLEIGSPSQKIPLLLNTESNSFGITSCFPKKNYTNKKIYNFNITGEFLKKNNYDYFNENKSSSFILYDCIGDDFFKAEYACPAKDTISFFEDINLKNKIQKNNLEFELLKNVEDNITGEIGLNTFDPEYRFFNSFLKVLSTFNLTKTYYWYFDFDFPKDFNGKLIIGSLPHENEPNKYSSNDLFYTKAATGWFVIYWSMKFDKIYINNKTDNNIIYLDNYVELKFDSNVIIGTYDYDNYISFILNDSIKEKKCFYDYIQGDSVYNQLKFYYCKNENDIKNKLYNILPTIYFFLNDFNSTLELTSKDILMEKGEYIYIQILYDELVKNKWKLGKIFSLKYKFILNPDSKQIGFYKNIKKEEDNDKNNSNNNNYYIIIKIIVIIILSIILILLGLFLGKLLFGIKRKKRANELNDDYEYINDENNNKNYGKNCENNDNITKNNIN